MKNDKSIVVNGNTDLRKVCNAILNPNKQKQKQTVETLKSTFATIGIK